MIHRLLSVFILCAWLLSAPAANAASLEGQHFDDQIRLGDTTLVLNGLGLRGVMFIKGYVAGLYLPARSSNLQEIAGSTGPKRLQLHMLRAAGPDEFVGALIGGIRKNSSAAELQALDERIGMLTQAIHSNGPSRIGDRVNFDYLPGVGTTLSVNGKPLGAAITGGDFYHAVLRIFMGDHPVDKKLKQGLLGAAA